MATENQSLKATVERVTSENLALSSEKVNLKEKNVRLLDELGESAGLKSELTSLQINYAEADKQKQKMRSREAQTESKAKTVQRA